MTYHITKLTMSCLSQGTVGLMPMLQGHNQLPELLYPPRMTFCGFVGWIQSGCPLKVATLLPSVFLFVWVNRQFDHHVFLDATQQNAIRNHIHFTLQFIKSSQGSHGCTGFPQFQGNERQHLFPSSQKPWRIMALQYSAICSQSS